ncbi:tetratricopeptide repeat protein [Aurantivibrio plasticivorans]
MKTCRSKTGKKSLLPAQPSNAVVTVFFASLIAFSGQVFPASQSSNHIQTRDDLEYGTILFNYYQQDYFNALIEYEYVADKENKRANSDRGHLLKGGMALSYGLSDVSESLFNALLVRQTEEDVRNRAWYYLAKLFYAHSRDKDAHDALEKIHGAVPADLHLDYHYLATLVSNDANHLESISQAVDNIPTYSPQHPYLLFNLGISYLRGGNRAAAEENLQAVVAAADDSEELQVLSDRARHGLAQLAIEDQQLLKAWGYLQNIRTTGLYSNRALLAYAWAAVRQQQYQIALPALQLLNERSISIPEVQEGKVLLGHLYEQQDSMNRALKSHITAEKQFLQGIQQVAEARRIIDMRDVPHEFIANLDAIVDDTDWYGTKPSVDYQKLTPFLIDLMASNPFNQVLHELADLYAIRDNLTHWSNQAEQHALILAAAESKMFDESMKQLLQESETLHSRLTQQKDDLDLIQLTLDTSDQERFESLLDNSGKELALLTDKLNSLRKQSEPYRQPDSYPAMVELNHKRIHEKLQVTQRYIAKLEPVMRNLVKVELDKHEERMRYYLAQSRLAKARLYDTALINLDNVRRPVRQDGD